MRSIILLVFHASIVTPAALHLKRDNDTEPYSLPSDDPDIAARTSALQLKHAGWTYGPPKAGNTSFYPTGALGGPAAQQQAVELGQFQDLVSANVTSDSQKAAAAITAAGGLKSLDDYAILYQNQWQASVPKGPFPGMLTNYTDDLLFSMESLSLNPFRIVRVAPSAALPFAVNNSASISGDSLESLQSDGRLFLSDMSDQNELPTSSAGKYTAPSQAYFYIDNSTGDFLPLAIKVQTNSSSLTYTPADSTNDWLMAKMLFNMNNFGHAEWYHLGATHALTEIVYLAAIRTLSDEHPVMAMLHRIMKEAFAIRVAAEQRLLYPGGPIDSLFAYAAAGASQYTTILYENGQSSAFQANYFRANLESRGLINSEFGPELKHFPYYEDGAVIHDSIHTFMQAFVKSYYKSPEDLAQDNELQSWIAEAGPAQIVDFPAAPLNDVDALVDILTHVAHIVSIVHGTLNTNTPVASDASLPFHPSSFWSPIPTSKGITDTDLMKLMPQVQASIGQIVLLAAFNRPSFVNSDQTITHMFDDKELLARTNEETRAAEEKFREDMNAFSETVRGRKFDERGLSQGMPFIWGSLDPNTASYWLTI